VIRRRSAERRRAVLRSVKLLVMESGGENFAEAIEGSRAAKAPRRGKRSNWELTGKHKGERDDFQTMA
jgi:hypothetical protein